MCGIVFSFKCAGFCKDNIKGLFYKCEKCVAVGSQYIEKEKLLDSISDLWHIWNKVSTVFPHIEQLTKH